MHDWQPIETAPKDGSFIRTFHPQLSPPERLGFWRRYALRWGYDGGNTYTEPRNQPTCWMPLREGADT